jgi:hypothetical protein
VDSTSTGHFKVLNDYSSSSCIADYAFSYCNKLTRITLPGYCLGTDDGVHYYDESTSNSCRACGCYLGYCTTVGEYAFQGCTGLQTVDIPESVTKIGAMPSEDWSNPSINFNGTLAQWVAIKKDNFSCGPVSGLDFDGL